MVPHRPHAESGLVDSLGLSIGVPFWMRATGSIALPAHVVMLLGVAVIGWVMTLTGGIFSFVANWLPYLPFTPLWLDDPW